MKELLAALDSFSKNPSDIGDKLFSTFHAIGKMDWEELIGAAGAINVLKDEAWRAASAAEEAAVAQGTGERFSALKDPTFIRMKSCLNPVVMRFGVLIASAPVEKQKMLIESLTGRHGFIDSTTRDRWLAAIPST